MTTSRIAARRLGVVVGLCGTVWAQSTSRASLDSTEVQGDGASSYPAISSDRSLAVFHSAASNLVPDDTNGHRDVFVRDAAAGTTVRVSVASDGTQGNGDSDFPSISANGQYVAFRSTASNLVVPDGSSSAPDIFVHDIAAGVTTLVSVSTSGAPANNGSHTPVLSEDGRFVAFASEASNLVTGDTNGAFDIFVHDRQSAITARVSISSTGVQANDNSFDPDISADGRYVAFRSAASNLVPQGGASYAVYVHDRRDGTTICASVDPGGMPVGAWAPSISAQGRHVAFYSSSSVIVPGDTNNLFDVFVHDLQARTTVRIVANSEGSQGNAVFDPSLSSNGRFVAFESGASDLVAEDSNQSYDVFVHDLLTATTLRVSVDSGSAQSDADSVDPSISPDGDFIVFFSAATNLVADDTNGVLDVFVRDRQTNTFASLCHPGTDAVLPCPCFNPPSDQTRGCDNSSATGGASLVASGVAYLSSDSLVFTSNGERHTATSILMQGNGSIPGGIPYGQGVRCVGGTIIRRLFTKVASAGSITAPDFGAGDPTVSARSAAKGDVIQPGQSRWYLVYYRDPIVLGGCPSTSTFNATQTGQVTWSP